MTKRKSRLIKNNMTGNIETRSMRIKAKIPFGIRGITEKNTFTRPWKKLMFGIWTQQWETSTTKSFKKIIIGFMMKKNFPWGLKKTSGGG